MGLRLESQLATLPRLHSWLRKGNRLPISLPTTPESQPVRRLNPLTYAHAEPPPLTTGKDNGTSP